MKLQRFYMSPDAPAGGAPKPKEEPAATGKEPVPYGKYKALKEKHDALALKVSEYEKSAPDTAKLSTERDEARNALAALEFRYEADVSLMAMGVTDPDDRAFIRERYNAAGEPGKEKPAFADYLEGVREKRWFQALMPPAGEGGTGNAAEPAPKSEYAANKGKPAEKVADAAGKGATDRQDGAKPKEKPAPTFDPNAGTKPTANGGKGRPAFTREEINGMSTDEYRANRGAILSATREGRIE